MDIEALARVSALEAEAKALRELRALRQDNGLAFYRPHLKQHKFHVADFVNRYLRTGNRFGKSDCGICESLAYAGGGRIWYRQPFDILGTRETAPGKYETYVDSNHPGGHNHPYVTLGIPQKPVKILIICVDWDKCKEVFTNRGGSYDVWGKLWKMIPKSWSGQTYSGGRGDRIEKIEIIRPEEFGGGISTIKFDTVESYKHNKMSGESEDYDYIHVDEPCPEAMFQAFSRGLMDRNGKCAFTCTPLDEMWINDKFTPPGLQMVKEAKDGLPFAPKGVKEKLNYIITGSLYDNPYRNEKGVANFESGLTREQRACRILGIPLAMAGQVYKEFIYDMHVLCEVPTGWSSYETPPSDYTIRVAWDVHQRLPQALLFAATAPNGDVFIYDEQFDESLIGPNAERLMQKLRRRDPASLLIDPFAVIESPVTGESVLDELSNYELYFEKASKDLTTGISKVRERLSERNTFGRPTIYFSPHLTETLYEFSHYVYDTDKNKPKDKDDHMMENLYRLVLDGLEYIPPVTESTYPKRSRAIPDGLELLDLALPSHYLS